MLHTIKEYIDILDFEGFLVSESVLDKNILVKNISYDSRGITEGTLFACKGEYFKEEYLRKALQGGAVSYLSEVDYGDNGIIVSDIRKAMAIVAKLYINNANSAYELIGIGGTKGKSTTLYFLKAIFDEYFKAQNNPPFGYISTIDTFDGIESFHSHITTPESFELARRFVNAEKAGLKALGMEVSSQALKYDRTYGVDFDYGIFTNFSKDHIGPSEHDSYEDYLNSKLKFFDQCKHVVLNLKTEELSPILSAAKSGKILDELITFSDRNTEIMGVSPDYISQNVETKDGISSFYIAEKKSCSKECGSQCYEPLFEIKISIPGIFNVENAMGAAIVALKLGVPVEYIQSGLLKGKADGRMETYKNDRLTIIVDYAHNAASYEKVFEYIKSAYKDSKVYALFGSTGDKAVQRRKDLPSVAAKYADFVYLTEDDPGFEDPMDIANEMKKYLGDVPSEIIIDREKAIRTAAANAEEGSVLILFGKGHDEYQHRNNDFVPIKSDSDLAIELTK